MQMLLMAAGAAWSAVAIDSIVETILAPGSAVRLFGRSIAFTGPRAEMDGRGAAVGAGPGLRRTAAIRFRTAKNAGFGERSGRASPKCFSGSTSLGSGFSSRSS